MSNSIFFPYLRHHPDLHSSLHDALPISPEGIRPVERPSTVGRTARATGRIRVDRGNRRRGAARVGGAVHPVDRKSTRLNSSHRTISYAVFCLKKKKNKIKLIQIFLHN